MPGVLIVEAMAQAGRDRGALRGGEPRQARALRRHRRRAASSGSSSPGDELDLECTLETVRGPIGRGKARATVGGKLAARGTLTFAVER